ncbi:MAG: hypothetical protein WKG06_03760 [Segetibacter sp.]
MDAAILEKVNVWLNGNYDQKTKDEIKRLQTSSPDELADSFYRNLEFGTGGLRGIMGVGTNRMNKYTVGMATQGFANYLKKVYGNAEIKVAIAHDCRNNSRFFAETAANVFAANGIKVYLFEDLATYTRVIFYHTAFGLPWQVWLLQLHTILKNTMDTKLTGMMAGNWYLLTIKM